MSQEATTRRQVSFPSRADRPTCVSFFVPTDKFPYVKPEPAQNQNQGRDFYLYVYGAQLSVCNTRAGSGWK
jgi:hypothetical protein